MRTVVTLLCTEWRYHTFSKFCKDSFLMFCYSYILQRPRLEPELLK